MARKKYSTGNKIPVKTPLKSPIQKKYMDSSKKNYLMDRIFDEIERHDELLFWYSEQDRLPIGQSSWVPISERRISQKIYQEKMKEDINGYLEKLVALLDSVIKSEDMNCRKCGEEISVTRLLSLPDTSICHRCQIDGIKMGKPPKPLRFGGHKSPNKNL